MLRVTTIERWAPPALQGLVISRGLVVAGSVLLVCVASAAMYLYMLGSNFGYDATVHLVIADDWVDGTPPFAKYAEGKPIGIYVLGSILLTLTGSSVPLVHLGVLLVNLTLVAGCVLVSRRWLSTVSLAVLAVLLLLLGFFTEMVYFLTEQPAAIAGLCALGLLLARARSSRGRVLLDGAAGAAIGVGFLFKQVDALYLVAALLLVWMRARLRQAERVHGSHPVGREATVLVLAAGLPLAAALLWAASQGLAASMAYLTLWMPLVEYGSHTLFLKPFLTKLGPLLLAWLVCSVAFLVELRRRTIEDERSLWRAGLLAFGGVSLASLWKNQASHYIIPALPFAVAFVVEVAEQWATRLASGARLVLACLAAAGVLALGWTYRGYAKRLTNPPDLAVDAAYARAIASLTRPGEQALLINGLRRATSYMYWTTGLRPPWRYLTIDQPAYALAPQAPGELLAAMRNEQTSLVSWDPVEPASYLDPGLPFSAAELADARQVLEQRFERVSELGGFEFPGLWKLKGRLPAVRPLCDGPFTDHQGCGYSPRAA